MQSTRSRLDSPRCPRPTFGNPTTDGRPSERCRGPSGTRSIRACPARASFRAASAAAAVTHSVLSFCKPTEGRAGGGQSDCRPSEPTVIQYLKLLFCAGASGRDVQSTATIVPCALSGIAPAAAVGPSVGNKRVSFWRRFRRRTSDKQQDSVHVEIVDVSQRVSCVSIEDDK
jgi:hypothetical protein